MAHSLRHLARLAALVTSGALMLAACGSSSTSTTSSTNKSAPLQTLTIGSSNVFPPTLNPTANASQAIDEVIDYNVLQHLVQLAPNGSIVPVLASSYTVSDANKVYTFTIRKGVKFSNGDPLTPADVVFSLKRVYAPGSTYPYGKIFDVSSVNQVGSDQVRVTLTTPSWNWLYDLAAYSNGVILDPSTISTMATDPIGTGPFKVTGEVSNYSVTLARNSQYWGYKPHVSGVVFRYFSNANSLNAALQSGQVNMIDNLSAPSDATLFKSNPKYKVVSGLTNGKVQMTLNNTYGPLRNKLVRQAILFATDRKAIMDAASGGYGLIDGTDTVPADPYYLNLANEYSYNVKTARKLMAKAGYAKGFNLQLVLPPYFYAKLAAPLIVSELGAIGIKVSVSTIDFPLWISQVFEGGNFQATIIDQAEGRDVSNYGTTGYYWHYAKTPEVASELTAANAAPTKAQWIAGYQKVLKQITSDAVNDWLYIAPFITVIDKNIVGIPTTAYTESYNLSYVGIGGSIPASAQRLGYLS
ncbi:ABC transporter substrate-binding protein [Ferrimicrobium acidiphilum]|uniref:Heme-binding protein A n=2 Tax=Ferrimicrobium acidiphilum TaxID=121039 RepID=A0A0D8FTQ9_9ACTN|nr:ABC transporter substrate-binding protein [Ferrimicrobium acidiphilum]KJE75642.1 heme-binding protein A precursor [Ferrimicrobium acidiphilum DSM 19497]MCL5052849.1 ABC transporter substrate-binding protein [Gammaproteobacteria bacterium]